MCWGCEQTYKEVMQPHLRAEVHEYRHPNMPDMLTLPRCQVTSWIRYPGYRMEAQDTNIGHQGYHALRHRRDVKDATTDALNT